MVQIKLFATAFILAAAAIVQVVALPTVTRARSASPKHRPKPAELRRNKSESDLVNKRKTLSSLSQGSSSAASVATVRPAAPQVASQGSHNSESGSPGSSSNSQATIRQAPQAAAANLNDHFEPGPLVIPDPNPGQFSQSLQAILGGEGRIQRQPQARAQENVNSDNCLGCCTRPSCSVQ